LLAVDLSSIERTARARVTEGNASDMVRAGAAGKGILVSDNFAQLRRLKVGDLLELPAPAGVIRLPIVGVIVDYSDQQGSILIDRAVFQRYWNDDSVNFFRVYLASGASLADVKRRILERFAGRRQVFVLNNGELRDYILKIATQWFALTYVQVAVATLIAVLGIVNMLVGSILALVFGYRAMREIDESVRWLTQLLQAPEHDLATPALATIEPLWRGALCVSVREGFRGPVVQVLETGEDGRLVHYKVQDPSLLNWFGLALAVRDNEISDFPICNKSFDLSYCGNDL